MTIEELADQVQRFHFPNAAASVEDIMGVESRIGYQLPSDMRQFYLLMNGASFFSKKNAPYRLLRLQEIRRAREAIFGSDTPDDGPESWVVFCELPDTNFVGLEFPVNYPSSIRIRDCNHAGFPKANYCKVIANGFTEFVEGILSCTGNGLYWLGRRPGPPNM